MVPWTKIAHGSFYKGNCGPASSSFGMMSRRPKKPKAGPRGKLAFLTFWAGFAFLWTALFVWLAFTNAHGNPWFTFIPAWIFGSAFCLAGALGWLSALEEVRDCERMAYGLTDRRALIVVDKLHGEVKSYTASAFASLSRKGAGGKGAILFDYGPVGKISIFRAGFYGIEQPDRVEALIHQTLTEPRKEGAAL